MQEARVESARRWLMVIVWAGVIFFLSSRPQDEFPDLGLLSELASMVAHFVVYAVLMLFLQRALRHDSAMSPGRALAVGLALVAVYALSDEYHQSFVPGRQPDPLDWLTDMTGALATYLALPVGWLEGR
jgi:VanZ family protein